MEKTKNIDFINMGYNCAKDALVSVTKKAMEIEKQYGVQARIEFESGATCYVESSSFTESVDMSDIIGSDFGEDFSLRGRRM